MAKKVVSVRRELMKCLSPGMMEHVVCAERITGVAARYGESAGDAVDQFHSVFMDVRRIKNHAGHEAVDVIGSHDLADRKDPA